jgi:arylsulfatase A-like enzyme
MKSFPLFVALLAAAMTIANTTRAEQPASAERPNIVLISLDTVRPDHLGAYGYSKPTSPNLDKLASEGVVFEKVWTVAPWTLPAHMSVFTSMLPSQHGVDSVGRVLPQSVTTLPQLLQQAGYDTQGIVNNGHMRAHWGFDRGFANWQEFEVDTDAGNCENLTEQATNWLGKRDSDKPFFLFMHYYDAHDAYGPPAKYREMFGSKLTANDARNLTWAARDPQNNIANADAKAQLIGSYDGEIRWMDDQLGKLFATLPANTMVVVFADHGEAFEEHGWTLHGATLYEEEIRVPLIVRMADGSRAGTRVQSPAGLMDIAPTILGAAGVEAPKQFTGMNLASAIKGDAQPARVILSENKAVLEGQMQRSAIAYPWKLVYSNFSNGYELYKLPNETQNLADAEPSAVEQLRKQIDSNLQRENFWMIHARGNGKHEITITVEGGTLASFIPVGFDKQRDTLSTSDNGTRMRWVSYPSGGTKSVMLEMSNIKATLSVDIRVNDERQPSQLFVGASQTQQKELPARVPAKQDPSKVLMDPRAINKDGVFVVHHVGDDSDGREDNAKALDAEVIEQLRGLGYIE